MGHFYPPTINQLKPWGCLAYVHSPDHASKLDATARRMIFMSDLMKTYSPLPTIRIPQ
ncbi:hypothetical protein CROQUDRAFT_101169 [Cronartium quercuum f. sp. fusiforme G11]|uniref:Uncharacterized protein n=1 Tax=Cronartium quercuum f. sp. fusiforme G11 TaxID=708437 RepID=A0A9P6N5J3_9BASI|nr:hypothetical protein CROQUDRAFT_101169 [Cronartium quercuum f. sp. fusiforme G11]